MAIVRTSAVLTLMFAAGIALAGCVVDVAAPAKASDPCDQAFSAASVEMNVLYDTHPLYGDEYDALYQDGEITAEEQTRLDAMMADENAAYLALVAPVGDACHGVEDLYAGAFAYRDTADWALQESEYVSREEAKGWFIVAFCATFPTSNACSDYDANDWK